MTVNECSDSKIFRKEIKFPMAQHTDDGKHPPEDLY